MTFDVAVQRLRAVADAAARLTATLPNGVPNLDAARARLAEGVPALAGEPLIDWPTLAASFQALGGDAIALRGSPSPSPSPSPAALCEAALADACDALPAVADRDATITLLDYAARPALRAGFAATKHLIEAIGWTRGMCPACGALPILAELHPDKHGHARILRCGRCTAAWPFARLACPACGVRDHTQVRYLHVDGELDYRRAECCASCGFYVKALARLDPIDDSNLVSTDLETLALDVLALDAGYSRQARSVV